MGNARIRTWNEHETFHRLNVSEADVRFSEFHPEKQLNYIFFLNLSFRRTKKNPMFFVSFREQIFFPSHKNLRMMNGAVFGVCARTLFGNNAKFFEVMLQQKMQ